MRTVDSQRERSDVWNETEQIIRTTLPDVHPVLRSEMIARVGILVIIRQMILAKKKPRLVAAGGATQYSAVACTMCSTATTWQASIIVRITADYPVIDPDLIDETVCAYRGTLAGMDGKRTTLPPTGCGHPEGAPIPSDWTSRCVPSPRWKTPGGKPGKPFSANT